MLKKRKNKWLTTVGALIMACTTHAQEISFSDSWHILQNKNNSIAAQRANVQRYQQLEEANDALNYPTVTLKANYTRLDEDVIISYDDLGSSEQALVNAFSSVLGADLSGFSSTTTEKDMFNSSIRVLWPIYTGGRITAAQSYGTERKNEAISRLKMETQARYDDLAKYYFSAVLAKDVLKTRQSVEKGLTQHRDFTIKLEQQGQVAKVERLQAEASLAKAVVERKKAQKNIDITTSALTEILNQTHKVVPKSALFINRSLPALSEFTDKTLTTYPGLDILNAKEKQASSAIQAERGKYHPEIYLFGDYTVYKEDSLASELEPDWFVGIGINVPIFENTGRSHKVQAAQSAVLQVRHLRQQARQDLRVLVEKTYYQAQQAIEEVEGLQSSALLAQENLRLRKKSFNQGLSTSLDVIDAELYLASIKTQQQVARFNYVIALNKLLALSSQMSAFSLYESRSYYIAQSEEKQ